MSKSKFLLAAAIVLVLVVIVLVTRNVSAGDPNGGDHGIIASVPIVLPCGLSKFPTFFCQK